MEFKKKIQIRLYISISYVVIGIAIMLISYFYENDMLSSLGLVFVVMGIARLRQYRRIVKNEEIFLKRKIAETDELNVKIWTEAKSLAFSSYIFILGVCCIILQILNKKELAIAFSYNIMIFIAIYWICYYITKKKYR